MMHATVEVLVDGSWALINLTNYTISKKGVLSTKRTRRGKKYTAKFAPGEYRNLATGW